MIDTVHGKLLVGISHGKTTTDVGLIRCNLDGTSCVFIDMAAGQPVNSGNWPSTVIDSVHNRLLIVAEDDAKNSIPALYTLGLW